MSSNVSLHPFFSKQNGEIPNGNDSLELDPQDAAAATDEHCMNGSGPAHKRARSRTRVDGKQQSTLGHLFKLSEPTPCSSIPESEEDERRKRRRTSVDESVNVGAERVQEETIEPTAQLRSEAAMQGILANGAAIDALPVPEDLASGEHAKTPPKKMLRLNANGKFKSPAKGLPDDTAPRRGRPRKAKEPPQPKQLVVCVKYTPATAGHKIEAILSGQLRVELSQPPSKKTRTPRKQKSTHPFFVDKPKAKKITIASPRRTAASTPGKLRMQAAMERPLFEDVAPVWESALLKDRLMIKHPGAKEPLWPAKGMSVRDPTTHISYTLTRRKHKQALPRVSDSLLATFAHQLQPEPEPQLRSDGFREPRRDLRIPQKLLLSGVDIAAAVAVELKAPFLQGELDELAPESSQTAIHPALDHLFHSIPTYLSGFDHTRGEQHSWSQRSAPQAANQILQPVKEMQILKSWLQTMAVNSVESKHERTAPDAPPRKKRKTRPAELDDFIVDDAEDQGMDSIADDEAPGSQSMIQTQVAGRPSNTVLISGPHGCGKTAAVYAIAKELQYRVFEISSAERRSGKDVLDKIGNVTENHIVKRHNADSEAELSGAEDKERIDAAFKEDLASGRHGKMNAFFKPAARPRVVKPVKANVLDNLKTAIKRAAKEQQQSLILLEEVDVLFKEDKEFWSTVLRLVQTSKRPFIMTCNDEDLVPTQALQLHAVLRLTPPPEDLAVDYLLLTAAKEGHLLRRTALTSLWRECCQDLRRALTTLDFWCRMGVGDIREGLGWIYQRWPVGSDLDDKGRPLRTTSRDTYHAGMGADEVSNARKISPVDLQAYSQAADALSSIDAFSTVPELDTTIAPLSQKRRTHFIEGLTLLDAPLLSDYTGLHRAIVDTAWSLTPLQRHDPPHAPLRRQAFASLDTLAYPITASGMEESVFDGAFKPLVLDIAPFVRQVVRYEAMLREHRSAISGPVVRARKTRVARSALEGGQRQLTRREEWWEGSSDMQDVLLTAGRGWAGLIKEVSFASVTSDGEHPMI